MRFSCGAVAPAWLCRHDDALLYLAPALALALVIRALARRHPAFFVFTLAGTVCHELTHFLVGFVTAARPGSFTVMPRRAPGGWELGAVTLGRVRWYNAAPAALAPLLLVLLPWWVAAWRTDPGWHFQAIDIALAFLVAPQFLACWPSRADWLVARRSWPALVLGVSIWLIYDYLHGNRLRSFAALIHA
ncbi:hypothetical protein [Pseudoduganella buxea]|uniref:M50 family peptidase n=1 Tax=Pseudoduganella buxea TaxID=1949069 RepID=A0A6I3SZA4_9BURK|nr:hypothetical protein [Pseudoduganella buxea]MTV54503.1 hypothetical protein [Pseudoduganella buxea]